MEVSINGQMESAVEQKFFDFFSEAIFVYCEEIVVIANDKAVKLAGDKDLSGIIGENINSIIRPHPDYIDIVDKRVKELHSGKCIEPIKHKLVRRDGMILDIEIAATPHIYRGRPATMLVINDITNKKDIEKKLKQTEHLLDASERRYQKIVELSPNAIFGYVDNKLIYANRATAELFGEKNVLNMIGRDIDSIMKIHPDSQEAIYKRRQLIRDDEITLPFLEQKLIKKDGTVFFAEAAAVSYMERGRFSSDVDAEFEEKKIILIIARDITKRKIAEENKIQLQKALEYDKVKTEFFSNISHELKTPLNIILGSIQLLDYLRAQNNGVIDIYKSNKYIKIMKQNCYRLLRLINNLIDITRMDVGFLKMNMKNYNIVEIIEDITQSVVEYIHSKGLRVTFDTELEEIVTACDADKIERVILNLLSNAIKFTPPGGEIFVNIYKKGDKFIVSVKDTGIGIPESMLEKIFERFKQVDQLFIRNREGSGIGLSLVKSIIEAHEGNIKAKSINGEGSEFIIELPIKILKSEIIYPKKGIDNEGKVERINVEFSDIYD